MKRTCRGKMVLKDRRADPSVQSVRLSVLPTQSETNRQHTVWQQRYLRVSEASLLDCNSHKHFHWHTSHTRTQALTHTPWRKLKCRSLHQLQCSCSRFTDPCVVVFFLSFTCCTACHCMPVILALPPFIRKCFSLRNVGVFDAAVSGETRSKVQAK